MAITVNIYYSPYTMIYVRQKNIHQGTHIVPKVPKTRRFGTKGYNRPGQALTSHKVGGNTSG